MDFLSYLPLAFSDNEELIRQAVFVCLDAYLFAISLSEKNLETVVSVHLPKLWEHYAAQALLLLHVSPAQQCVYI